MSEKGGKVFVVNAISLSMFPRAKQLIVNIEEVSPETAKATLLEKGFISYIGHESSARALSELLGISIQANRSMLQLPPGQYQFLVMQIGIRLPEGAILSRDDILKLHTDGALKLLLVTVDVKD